MVSHEGFLALGYAYAVLGCLSWVIGACLIGTGFGTIQGDDLLTEEKKSLATLFLKTFLGVALIMLLFYVVLLVGIATKKAILVIIHKVYLIIYIGFGIIALIASFSRADAHPTGIYLATIVLNFLFLMIVNEVIAAIKHNNEMNANIAITRYLDNNYMNGYKLSNIAEV